MANVKISLNKPYISTFDLAEFTVNGETMFVDIGVFLTVATALNWDKLMLIKTLVMLCRYEKAENRPTLKSAKEVVEYLIERFKPAPQVELSRQREIAINNLIKLGISREEAEKLIRQV